MTRWLLFFAAAWGALPCAAREIAQQKDAGRLEVRFDGATPKIALADLITVTLTIEGRKGLRVRAPDRFPLDFPWQIVESSKPRRSPLDGERESWRLVYRLAPRAPGAKVELKFPDVQVRETESDTEDQVIRWDPIVFEVESSIAKVDRNELSGITGVETTPTPPVVEPFDGRWLLLAGAIVLALSIALGVRRVLRRRSPRSPAELALYEWQRLMQLGLPEKGRTERFITLLTLLVRQYLERQFAIPARRQTTPEFLAALANHTLLTADEKQFLAGFLQQSEAIKFGNAAPSIEECGLWADAARRFLASGK